MFLNGNDELPNITSQSVFVMSARNSAADMPVAKAPPTRPPMLVPAAASIGIWFSSNHLITPMCAMPLALPPPNATPTVRRAGCAAAGWAARTIWVANSTAARARTNTSQFIE